LQGLIYNLISMKVKMNYSIIAGIALIVALSGCSKKDNTDPSNTTSTTTNYASFSFENSYGVLVAIKSISYQEAAGIQIPIEVNTASATFVSSPGSSTFIDAGQVTLNTKVLSKETNNSYIYQDLLNPLNFNTVSWSVTGANGIPTIAYSDDKPWPSFNGFTTLPATVTKSAGVTVNLNSAVSNADSVYLILASNDGNFAIKRVSGNAADVTLSASEISGITAGSGMIQLVPWSFKKEDFDSKDFYFVLEAVYSKMNVTIN